VEDFGEGNEEAGVEGTESAGLNLREVGRSTADEENLEYLLA
jgi:hypothetical protein